MASSSSSHQQNEEFNAFSGKRRMVCESSRLFDVFINHRGPDVKQTLAIHLYNSLEQLGIRTFLDSQEKELGDSFPSTIQTAISSASIHIAIFSKGYADSAWCLAELVLMLESQAKIIPLFYGVKPSDLRYIETGAYAEAFVKYKEKSRYLEKLNEWKEALQSLSLIAGEEFNSFSDWHCQTIVAAVQKEVQRKTPLQVAQYPVALNNLVNDFERHCLEELVQDFESQCWLRDKAKAVGIFGMGGAGKTTLVKELFNRKSWTYERSIFLFDVREASERRELPSLQRKLLKDLFHKRDLSFTSIEEGKSYLKDSLERSPAHFSFLIVVDDINHVEQLNALLIMDIVNKLGNSLVLVTTRDIGVLMSAGITNGYRLRGMDRNYGSELFCWHAFDQPNPFSRYEELVKSFVDVCGGLPLSLQVLGRHVHGRSMDYWRSELVEVRKTLPQDVKRRLKISFDALNAEEKQIFMDIACIFGGRKQSLAEIVWEGLGWNAQHALNTLRDKCLIEEIKYKVYGGEFYKGTSEENNLLRMHDHLRDLGREMALEFSPPHRLWRPQDLTYLESRDFRNILSLTNVRCFHSIFDKSMNSQVVFFLGGSGICLETSASLLWLQLEDNSSIPSWIPLQCLQSLKIKRLRLKTSWWNHTRALSQLKKLHIDQCPELKELTFGHLSCLEKIIIKNCSNLKGVLEISNLAKLVTLKISRCEKLDLECFCLRGMKCLQSITFDRSVKVKYFMLDSCQILKTVEFNCQELVELSIRGCQELEELTEFRGPSCVERIIIDGCRKLKRLQVYGCRRLRSVSGNLRVKKLCISDCPELEECPSLSYCREIDFDSCEKIQNLTVPTTLMNISIRNCRDLQSLAGIGHLIGLTKLYISDCPELEELLSLSKLRCLERIVIYSCEKVEKMASTEELHELINMQLFYCSNAVIQNCIPWLKTVQSNYTFVIGKAMDGAESALNEYLFCDANIGVDAVTKTVTEIGAENGYKSEKWRELITVIVCCLVVVDGSTPLEDINESLPDGPSLYAKRLEVRQGEWIITMVARYGYTSHCYHHYMKIDEVLRRFGIMKKRFVIEVKKDEEWKGVQVLCTIVNKLYHL
ncbi:disease resistance protein Roq1-like isoform X1 [Cryptomeria japonica]|uniref:disease resistance protein Roq1-like isoform X1 n=1 Tax=Cryptomeria japonica TaxID=3369 RepID=UPI0027D9F7B0|nr:disease resistance protein Roq1-like isoform X1 [Cryptomeria japonica]